MIRRAAVLSCAAAVACACVAWLSARAYELPLPGALTVVAPALLIAVMRTLLRVPRTSRRTAVTRVPGPTASTEFLAGSPSSSPAAEVRAVRRRAARGARYHLRNSPPRLIRRH